MENIDYRYLEFIRRSVTKISTETFKDESVSPIKFLMVKDWACLLTESKESIDFKLPRTIHIYDVKGKGSLYIHRATKIEKTLIKTDDKGVEVHTMDINDDEIVKLIREFVRKAYENEQADSTKEDYWENIEEKINVVSDFLLSAYATEFNRRDKVSWPDDDEDANDAMKKQFGDKYCVKSSTAYGYPTTQQVTDLAQKKPHLKITDIRFTEAFPISEEKKKQYSNGIWEVLSSPSWDFDERNSDVKPLTQVVFLRPKK